MHLVERMVMAPNCCLTCGCGNTPNGQTGEVGPFVDLAIDYNWGDSGYICGDCAAKIAVLFGWISPDTKLEYDRQVARLEKQIHDLESDLDRRRIRERKALKQVRALT